MNLGWVTSDGSSACVLADGLLLFEADRILRHGGFFAWIMDLSDQGIPWSGLSLYQSMTFRRLAC